MRRNYYITVGITESGVEKLKDNHDAEGEDIFSKTASEEEFNEIKELHFDIYEKNGVYIDEYENAKIPHSIVDDIMKQIKNLKIRFLCYGKHCNIHKNQRAIFILIFSFNMRIFDLTNEFLKYKMIL